MTQPSSNVVIRPWIGLFVLLMIVGATDQLPNDTYVSLPNQLYLGIANKVIVRTTYPNTRVTVATSKYRLKDVISDPKTYQTELLPGGLYGVEIPYRVPFYLTESRTNSLTLNFTMFYCETSNCEVYHSHSLIESHQVIRPPIHVLGETEKPLYRPGETVRFRFLVLTWRLLWPHPHPLDYPSHKLKEEPEKNELKMVPVTEDDMESIRATLNPTFEEISLFDASNTRVKQWLDVSPAQAFLLNYTLLPDAPNGQWKITARLHSLAPFSEDVQFTVKQYVLPRFTISMTHPQGLSFESKYAQFGVCARYTNGPPMTGSVRAHLCACSSAQTKSRSDQNTLLEDQACVPVSWRPERRPCIPISGLLSPTDGCVTFNVSTELLHLQSPTYPTWDQVPVVCAHVEEQGTGSNVSRCEPGLDTIKHTQARFELKAPTMFKPDIPVIGSLRLIHPDLPNLENVTVQLLAEETTPHCFYRLYRPIRKPSKNRYRFTQILQTDANGVAEFQLPPINAKRSVFLEVTYRTQANPSTEAPPPETPQRLILPRRRPPKLQEGVTAHQELDKWLSSQLHAMVVWPSIESVQVSCPGFVSFQLLANIPLQDKIFHVEGVIRGRHFYQIISPTSESDRCVDRNDQLGHYRCIDPDQSDEIQCLPGWSGDNCLVPQCTNPCFPSGGVCSAPEQCTCFPHWSGLSCEVCTDPKQCDRSEVQVETVDETETEPTETTVPTAMGITETSESYKTPRRTLHLRNISFPVDGHWGPEATVVVYFITNDGFSSEMVPVTIKLQNIPTCISPATAMESTRIKSGLSLSQTRVSPGQRIQLTLIPIGLDKPKDNGEDNDMQYCFVRMQDKSLDNFDGDKSLIDLKSVSKLEQNENKYYGPSEPTSVDSAFRAAGLRLMSNRPTEFIQPTPCPYAALASPMNSEVTMDGPTSPDLLPQARGGSIPKVRMYTSPVSKSRLRDFFPEVWSFDYYPIQWNDTTTATKSTNEVDDLSGGYVRQMLTVPDTITSWRTNAFCTTKSNGLWMPNPIELTTSMPFFVEITLPNQVKRGEILYLPLSVFVSPTKESGIVGCMDVSVSAQLNESDWTVIGGQAFTGCVCPGEKKTFQLGLLSKRLGMLNVTVEAYAQTNTDMCTNIEMDQRGAELISQTFSDVIRRAIKVEPEGMRRDLSQGDILCLTGDEVSVKASFPITLPDQTQYVPDSLRVYLSYSDEVLGPALANLDKLVRLPVGCGEQNMVIVAPNVYILDYFKSVGASGNSRAIEKLQRDAKMHIVTGYQRQLKYRHDDGSYSAFGKTDKEGSTWLTAFVLRVFAKAYRVDRSIQIDWSTMFTEITQFIKQRQDKNTGCFIELGRVLHSGMQGGAGTGDDKEKELLLTAYILAAILETKPYNGTDFSSEFSPMIEAASRCLYHTHKLARTETINKMTTYALAQLAYTLILLDPNSEKSVLLQQELVRRQQHLEPLGLSHQLYYWLARQKQGADVSVTMKTDALDVETTSYALLTFSKSGLSTQDLFPSIRWLSSQQKPEGGFFSTQDTVLALEAITHFAKRLGLGSDAHEPETLSVQATLEPVSFTITDKVNAEKRHVLNQFVVSDNIRPNDVHQVTWTVSSSTPRGGCLSVHSSFMYHVHDEENRQESVFQMVVLTQQAQEPPANACSTASLSICLKPTVDNSQETGMLLITVNMVSGWKPIQSDIFKQVNTDPENPRQVEFAPDDSTVSVYFNGFARSDDNSNNWVTEQKRCVQISLEQIVYVKNTKAAVIEAMDYYATNRRVSKVYTLNECPSAWKAKPGPSTEQVTTSVSTESTQFSEKPIQLHYPDCQLSEKQNQTLNDNLLKYVCGSWFNFLAVKVLGTVQDQSCPVTLSSIGYGRIISHWNATLVLGGDPDYSCESLANQAQLLWISPQSKLNVEPGDPKVSIKTEDPDALLIPMRAVWSAVQLAREKWQAKADLDSFQINTCARIDTLWRYIKVNLK